MLIKEPVTTDWRIKNKMFPLNVNLPDEIKVEMKEAIQILGISQSDYVRLIIDRANKDVLQNGKL